jgi:hypothetical protein
MLRDIFEILEPGGRFCWTRASATTGWIGCSRGACSGTTPPQHLWVFSGAGMERLVRDAGFQLERLDPCFERSRVRKAARTLRNGAAAVMLRASCAASRLRTDGSGFGFTRFPLGNLMSLTARRPA